MRRDMTSVRRPRRSRLVSSAAFVLALVTLGDFSGATAAQIGLSSLTPASPGAAAAVYFSAYYVAGCIAGYLPGLAWERWGWSGVTTTGAVAFALGLAMLAAGRWMPGMRPRRTRDNGIQTIIFESRRTKGVRMAEGDECVTDI